MLQNQQEPIWTLHLSSIQQFLQIAQAKAYKSGFSQSTAFQELLSDNR